MICEDCNKQERPNSCSCLQKLQRIDASVNEFNTIWINHVVLTRIQPPTVMQEIAGKQELVISEKVNITFQRSAQLEIAKTPDKAGILWPL